MRCRIGSVVRRGPAVTVTQDVDADAVVAAVRETGADDIEIECASPTPVHERIGHIHGKMGLRTRTALAEAARTQGYETPYDEDIDRLESAIATISVEQTGIERYREALAAGREETDAPREAVAATRGRLAAHREQGLNTDELERELESKVRELAETETSTTAASQQFERTREQLRERRDRRERQLELADRLANRRRDARRWLVEQVEAEFVTAVRELPGESTDPFDCPAEAASLALGNVAEYAAPLVLETSPFESTAGAHEYLGGPVILL
jgi:hypothetical protein